MNMNNKVLLVIMDGIGISKTGIGDANSIAYTPTLDRLKLENPNIEIKAHGIAVGLPSNDDMGNSEVGHNTLGCGQIYSQGAKLVNESISNGTIFQTETWNNLKKQCIEKISTLHLIGLLSDGKVHSDINHVFAIIDEAKASNIQRIRIHILLDGRDVPPTSALEYVKALEEKLLSLNDNNFDYKIASGGGRMVLTMDRYQADWNMVKLGWETHVLGLGRQFSDATEAIITYRQELDVIDQNLPPFVIAKDGVPIGRICDNDSVILFNFRGDRAIELSMAFENDHFEYFDRVKKPNVYFAGMLQYDGDFNIPKNYLVDPPEIKNTLSELLIKNEITQYAISETQKYGHVTYFWNGNKSGKFSEELETYYEVPSYKVPFDERPWMKAAEITDKVIEAMASEKYSFIRCNYPNGDMIGHTGNMAATAIAVSTVDLQLSRLIKVCDIYGYALIVTADHGNADEMLEISIDGTKNIKTAHSLNSVPFIIYDNYNQYSLKIGDFGLANVAPTIASLFGIEVPLEWEESMIKQ